MKIAIVNDNTMSVEALRRVILGSPEHQLAWSARSGSEAVRLCAEQRPDLILMDLLMPEQDGIETTRCIMQASPCAILIVTASPGENSNLVFRAMGAGALDVVATPVLSERGGNGAPLLAKIRTIAKLVGADRPAARDSHMATVGTAVQTLVAIGASTGGPTAIARVLADFTPAPTTAVVVVQHIDEYFSDLFGGWLAQQIKTPVDVIRDGSELRPGTIHIAKTNDHLCLDKHHRLLYNSVPMDYPYRPSIDVFFDAIARHWQQRAIGILLTGMGRDGANGLLAMRRARMLTIAQDQHSSVVYGMPRAAAELDAAEFILALDAIGPALQQKAGVRRWSDV